MCVCGHGRWHAGADVRACVCVCVCVQCMQLSVKI
jgi:hypothetical protein